MNKDLLKVSIRQNAIYLPLIEEEKKQEEKEKEARRNKFEIIKEEIKRYINDTTQANVGIASIKLFLFALPPFKEQQEIVNQIEKHFSIIDKLENVVQKSINESKRLRQSILKQAFEGKLVEQDPNDESASVLLEKIAKAKEEYQKAMKRKK